MMAHRRASARTSSSRRCRSTCSRPRSSAASARSPAPSSACCCSSSSRRGRRSAVYRLAVTGVGLLVVLYAFPGGIGQLLFAIRDRYLRWVANRHDLARAEPRRRQARRGARPRTTPADEVDLAARARWRERADDGAAARVPAASTSPTGRCRSSSASTSRSQEGEIVALLGTNGAGKSTLLKGDLRPGEAQARARSPSPARTSPTCPPTSPPTGASR